MYSEQNTVCFFFELHQPMRINMAPDGSDISEYFIGPIGSIPEKYNTNAAIFHRIAQNCYIPGAAKWLQLLQKHPELKISLSLSGTWLDQAQEYAKQYPEILANIQSLIDTGRCEIVCETYYHSLACLFSAQEFVYQIIKHRDALQKLFGYTSTTFRNTEMIYSDFVGEIARNLGFSTCLIEDESSTVEQEGGWKVRSAKKLQLDGSIMQYITQNYNKKPANSVTLLAKNYRIMDAFFMMQHENGRSLFNLTSKYLENFCGIYSDFEIFGEHNNDSAHGVFQTLEEYISLLILQNIQFVLPKDMQAENTLPFECMRYTSWTNSAHDLRSWKGNSMQELAYAKLVELFVVAKPFLYSDEGDEQNITNCVRYLSTSDHLYYMSRLDGGDGQMHDMFNAFETQQQAFDVYMHVLETIQNRIVTLTK
jgi:alpha-amylase